MTRLLQRGSSTTRLVEDGWSHNEAHVKLDADEEEGENHGKLSLLILLSGVLRRGLTSPLKLQQKEAEFGFRSADMPDGNSSLRSLLNGPHNYKGFFTQLPDASSFSFYSSQSNSTTLGHPASAQSKKVLAAPLARIVMLSFISIFVLVAVLGSTSTGYSSNPASRLIYSSYRKLQEDFSSLDLTSGGVFGLGAVHPKELTICPKDMEHHVPCYNASAAARARSSGDLDRHCELSDSRTLCLIRPPKNYTLPLQWPHSRTNVWLQNSKGAHEFKEFRTERIMSSEEHLLTFESGGNGSAEMHFRKIADILGIQDDSSFSKIGVRTVLDIGCSYGAFVAHLLSRDVKAVCIAHYETQNSHVQIALDRGLPAMIGSLVTRELPYPASSFDMIQCANCGIDWSQKDGLLLLEVDRLLKGDGYFVWTMPTISHSDAPAELTSERVLGSITEAAKSMCWASLPTKDQVFIWRKSADRKCFAWPNRTWSLCDKERDGDIILYRSLRPCLDATKDGSSSPTQQLNSLVSGFFPEEISDDSTSWFLTVKNYWSIITPLLFSDHPKRPAEDDPLPPSNFVRNVMDMNALYGGFNTALLQAGKSVWVMNVVPTSGPNTLPMIFQRGLTGTLHDWCEAFPTYPRTYDLLHAIGLLSQVMKAGCNLPSLLLEMDRILRPEGWVLLRDSAELIEEARIAAAQMRWEARTIEVEGNDDLRLLVCQKVFWKA
ncbi:hypothetical protein GOP47_0003337 [Adiantum capillus-veneris]|nr:hypothetical protein GOP47_0003337 [Adiantum capillus-veneris]